MWVEAIVPRDDIARLLGEALPLTIHFGAPETQHSLGLYDLEDVRLVPDVGLRVVCKARVHWPVLGIDLPISLKTLTAVLAPTIGKGPHGDTLVFRAFIEHADFAGLPSGIDG